MTLHGPSPAPSPGPRKPHTPSTLAAMAPAVADLAGRIGDWMLAERAQFDLSRIEHKGLHDLVSYVDKEGEEQLVEGLRLIDPDADYLTEEGTTGVATDGRTDPGPGRYWIIDPLDGTTNYLHGLPVYGVSIGLVEDGRALLGVIYDPSRQETFVAWQGGGAYLNGQPITVTDVPVLSSALLATGFPYTQFDRQAGYLAALDELMRGCHGLRRMGSAALDLAYVACGRFDGFFEYRLKAWDAAAGIIIVTEAGGIVSDFSGGDNFLYGGEMIAAGPALHGPLLEVVGRHLSV